MEGGGSGGEGGGTSHVGTLHTGRLKKQTWVEKTSVRALVTCDKTPTTVT